MEYTLSIHSVTVYNLDGVYTAYTEGAPSEAPAAE